MANKNKIVQYASVGISAIMLIAAISVGSVAAADIVKKSELMSEQKDCYIQTTYYQTESDYNAYIEQKRTTCENVASLPEGGQFVMGVSKKIRALEGLTMFGISISSIPLPEERIEEYAEKASALTIDLAVTYMPSAEKYYVAANAQWQAPGNLNLSAKNLPWDYLGITWGGEGYLLKEDELVAGTYPDDGNPYYTKWVPDSYHGNLWWFEPHNKSGYISNTAISFTLSSYRLQDKQTNIRMMYVHSYGNNQVYPEFQGDGTTASNLIMSDYRSCWQIDIEITGLKY